VAGGLVLETPLCLLLPKNIFANSFLTHKSLSVWLYFFKLGIIPGIYTFVSVNDCCITNHLKTWWLKTAINCLQFCGLIIWAGFE
jgi:hypothetical protein